ncbi:MAG: VWA domain-containing protein, partial [Planctomycetes bacterium]|nr:VWA domain-containing protein [Planctomycetota bacterium]
DIDLYNPSSRRLEAELLVPVPDRAVVRGFAFQGAAAEPTAQILTHEEARRIYNEIVARVRDPALLEFAGYNLVRSSVFPVAPRGTQRVRLVYEHLLPADGNRIDYVLPRSESLAYNVPWGIHVKLRSRRPISTVYSPTHDLITTRHSAHALAVTIKQHARTEPGPFRLSYLLDTDGVSASLLAYPDPTVGGGYFLLLAGLPADAARSAAARGIQREVTIVIDRSGSMRGEKLQQVGEAALQVIAGLEPGEAFNLIVYNEVVDLFSETPVRKTPQNVAAAEAYLKGITARGGTNLYDALSEALRLPPADDALPLVLFLTDGLPTVGQTSEAAIRDMVLNGNRYDRRIFTFGVGVDVNTPLLEKIAFETRAASTFILPDEDVEVKVAQVFKRLAGPVLADGRLRVLTAEGAPAANRVRDVLPSRLPDLFEGDQLVLLGQYIGSAPLTFELSGNFRGQPRQFRFSFDLDRASTRNAFVPRLWASRKIAMLIDAIRQLGADSPGTPGALPAAAANDPRLRELVTEVVRLSTEFGILTEYTAFLAREGTDLSQPEYVLREAARNFTGRAIGSRSGLSSVNQTINIAGQKQQRVLNRRNRFLDEQMNTVQIARVQQVADRAFYRRGQRWIDSRIVNADKVSMPDRTIEFGSDAFWDLLRRLVREDRAGCVSLTGDILLQVDGETLLIRSSATSMVQP